MARQAVELLYNRGYVTRPNLVVTLWIKFPITFQRHHWMYHSNQAGMEVRQVSTGSSAPTFWSEPHCGRRTWITNTCIYNLLYFPIIWCWKDGNLTSLKARIYFSVASALWRTETCDSPAGRHTLQFHSAHPLPLKTLARHRIIACLPCRYSGGFRTFQNRENRIKLHT